jgi:WD40 repeat protein
MDLKDKQIEKLNEANDYIKEINDMRSKMEKLKIQKSMPNLVNTAEEAEELKQVDIMGGFTPKAFERSHTVAIPNQNAFNVSEFAFAACDVVPSHVTQKYFAHEKEATCLAFSLGGNLLATGGGDGLIKIWDVNKECETQMLKAFNRALTCVAFSYDSENVMGCSVDKSVKFFKLRTGKITSTLTGHYDTINACVCAHS